METAGEARSGLGSGNFLPFSKVVHFTLGSEVQMSTRKLLMGLIAGGAIAAGAAFTPGKQAAAYEPYGCFANWAECGCPGKECPWKNCACPAIKPPTNIGD